jgi:polysaccharide export outer membrane protein
MKEIDLTTYEGLLSAELKVMPHDIIYVEPRRRPFKEFVNDLGTVSNVISSAMMIILTTVFLLDRAGGK